MVRIKYRYFLLNILYPDSSPSQSTVPTYLGFHAPTPQHVNASLFLSHLRSQITVLYGDHGLGVSQSSLKLVYFSQATSTAILRVPRAHFRLTWAVLTFLNELPGPIARGRDRDRPGSAYASKVPCVIRVVRVSGTIKKSEEELLRRGRREVVRAKMLGQGDATASKPISTIFIDDDNEVAGIEDDDTSE